MEGYLLAFQPSKHIFGEMKREILSAPNLKKTCESPTFGHSACRGHSSRPAGSPDDPLPVWRQCLFGCLILLFVLPWKIYRLFPWSFPFSLSCLVCLDLSSLGQGVSIREIHFLNHLKGASWWVPRKKRLFLKSLGWAAARELIYSQAQTGVFTLSGQGQEVASCGFNQVKGREGRVGVEQTGFPTTNFLLDGFETENFHCYPGNVCEID